MHRERNSKYMYLSYKQITTKIYKIMNSELEIFFIHFLFAVHKIARICTMAKPKVCNPCLPKLKDVSRLKTLKF